jgi:transcriptional regulator with XRE-family HTH domain
MSPPITIFEAARRANVSEGTWRNAARGTRHLAGGGLTTYEPDPPTLARMARAVGITPDELRQINRVEAAAILESARPAGDARLADFDDETLLRELLERATRSRTSETAPTRQGLATVSELTTSPTAAVPPPRQAAARKAKHPTPEPPTAD